MLPSHSLLLPVFVCRYSPSPTLVLYRKLLDLGPFEREISHPIQKRTLRLPAIKTALGREKRIPCRSGNPACDTSPLVSSNSEESVMCRPPLILPQKEIYKDIGINKNNNTRKKRNKHRKRGRVKYK